MPQFAGPKLLSFIVSVHNTNFDIDKNDSLFNKKTVKLVKSSQPILHKDDSKSIELARAPNIGGTNAKTVFPIDIQSFGSVDLIPVSNSSCQENKVPKAVNNFVEITPLQLQNGKKLMKVDKQCDSLQTNKQGY